MIRPTRRAVLLLALGLPVALLPALAGEGLWVAWVAYLLVLLAATALDAILLPPQRSIRLEVDCPKRLYIGTTREISVRVSRADGGPNISGTAAVDLGDLADPCAPQQVQISNKHENSLIFPLRARRRGALLLDKAWLHWAGPLGLMARVWSKPVEQVVPVIPDLGAVRTAALQFFGNRRTETGLKSERYTGDGTEFESLRHYVTGLDIRSIDWKATARNARLMCREYRAERNHQVIIALDCGHLMSEPIDGIPRIDHAITNALTLGYCCLRTGDRVGLYSFDSRQRSYLAPQGGIHSFPDIQQESANIEYGTDETNFTLGILQLSQRLKRRSLIVVFTDFTDSVSARLMVENLDRLARRHLVLFVALADPLLQQLEDDLPGSLSSIHQSVVASDLHQERRKVFARLRRSGIQLLEIQPGQVSTSLINRYLEIKWRELV